MRYIALIRQGIRFHDLAVKRIKEYGQKYVDLAKNSKAKERSGKSYHERLLARFRDLEDELNNHELVMQMLADRFQNLVDLVR